jgi:hypothetical protein
MFAIEAIKALLDNAYSLAVLFTVITIAVTIALWPWNLGHCYRKTLSISLDENEYILLQVKAHSLINQSSIRGCLIVTNRRIIFHNGITIQESMPLIDILFMESRSRILGIERWIRIVSKDKAIILGVNYPRCLKIYIESIINDHNFK